MADSPRGVAILSVRTLIGPFLVLLILAGALWLLHAELRQYNWNDVFGSLVAISRVNLGLAAALTVANYTILIGYDLLGLRYIRQQMSFYRVALASFLSYAVGNSFGLLLGGTTIRYRLYSGWGLSSVEIVKLVLLLSVTFWIGLFALAGLMFIIAPAPIPDRLHLPFSTTLPIGVVFSALAVGYLVLCAARRTPLSIRSWDFMPPSFGFATLQFAVTALDLLVAAGVLYALLPPSIDPGFPRFLSVYLLSIVAAFLSQVPSGLGVMDLVLLVLLSPTDPSLAVGPLLAYRIIYYFCPLALGVVVLGVNEALRYRSTLTKSAQSIARIAPIIAPRFLALTVFLAGGVLLLSGATPAAPSRLELLRRVLPLPVVEVSHFLNSILGLLLLLVARGLHRRVETAYYVASALLGLGIVVSLLKGFDYEEALLLSGMLAAILPCRRHFYRRGALLTERFTLQWFTAIGMVIGCTAWLMLFTFKHVEYRDELWWQFAFQEHAPRSLRALAGVLTVTLAFACWRLLRVHVRSPSLPNETDMADARHIVENSRQTSAHLAMLGDKHFFFNAERTALIMYGVEGRSWVAMGDPIGDPSAARELAWDFLELCDEGGRWPVFYQIDDDQLSMYVEMGMTVIKLGEEAHVPLPEFSLEGNNRRNLRRAYKQLSEDGCTFEIVEPPVDAELLVELKRISDAWLSAKHTAEKSFSLGSFQPDYLQSGPIALVRQSDKLIGFANIWKGANHEELSIDLMRHLPDASHSTMEFLLVSLMIWGRTNGYQRFNLGMAPLSGIEQQRLAPLWSSVAGIAFRHGEHFYNFQGLRQYKEKFHPEWRAKYMASPGGLALPLILANVASLISGGLKQLVTK